MDLLARLHMEFLADPLDLELRMLVLVGEISDNRTYKHLAREFGAQVVELLADPVLTVPLAHRRPTGSDDGWQTVEGGPQLLLARPDADALLEAPYPAGLAEIVAHHPWHPDFANIALRTGYVARIEDQAKAVPAPSHTVGDRFLVRGRWLSTTRLADAMRVIDGITRLRLEVERKGTLDTATLHVAFGRESLTNNPMWRARIEQALTDLTPVHIGVQVDPEVHETVEPLEVLDLRGHHLGRSRSGILSRS
jgi:phenylacetate-CoA ligase